MTLNPLLHQQTDKGEREEFQVCVNGKNSLEGRQAMPEARKGLLWERGVEGCEETQYDGDHDEATELDDKEVLMVGRD